VNLQSTAPRQYCGQDLSGHFVLGKQTHQIVDKTCREDHRYGAQKPQFAGQISQGIISESERQEQGHECEQVRKEHRNPANARSFPGVKLADIIRLVYQTQTKKKIPDYRRQHGTVKQRCHA
jgi:hypothetical protein